MHAEPATHTARELAAVALLAIGVGLAVAFAPTLFVPCDFIAFWSSATLFADRHNPYDPALLFPIQYEAGFKLGYAITMFNPPWVLPLLAPLGALPVRPAFAIALAVQFALVLVAAGWLWRASGGSPDRKWVAAALAVAFAPTFLLLTGGQLTGLTLFGLAGYVYFRVAGRPYLAGCLGALTAVKPHLFVLFAVALVIDAVRDRDGRKVVLAGALTLLALSVVALAVNPDVFRQYVHVVTAPSSAVSKGMTDYAAPVVGVMLRDAIPGRPGAVAFLPLCIGVLALVACARRLPTGDRAAGVLPFLVAASLVVAPYGGWWYDLMLLLPLVLLAAVRLSEVDSPGLVRTGLVAFVLLDAALMVLYSRRDQLTPLFALVPPVVVFGCYALLRATRQPATFPQPQPAA
jgi:hypothetical protein